MLWRVSGNALSLASALGSMPLWTFWASLGSSGPLRAALGSMPHWDILGMQGRSGLVRSAPEPLWAALGHSGQFFAVPGRLAAPDCSKSLCATHAHDFVRRPATEATATVGERIYMCRS